MVTGPSGQCGKRLNLIAADAGSVVRAHKLRSADSSKDCLMAGSYGHCPSGSARLHRAAGQRRAGALAHDVRRFVAFARRAVIPASQDARWICAVRSVRQLIAMPTTPMPDACATRIQGRERAIRLSSCGSSSQLRTKLRGIGRSLRIKNEAHDQKRHSDKRRC